MLSTSWDYRLRVSENTRFLIKATLTLANGSVHELTGDDIMSDSVAFSQGTSSSGSFDVGSAIIGSFSCTLQNDDRRFDSYDFTGSKILVFLGMPFDDGSIEWLRKGTFWIEQPASYSTTIGISSLDTMCKFENTMFSEVITSFPATAATLVQDICNTCGIPYQTLKFGNCDYIFPIKPKDDMTCREALSYIAQATGNWVRMSNEDRMIVDWYDLRAFESEDWLDGETFDDGNPYQSGDDADGGNFDDYSSGDNVEGGSFNADRIVNVVAYSSATVITDDVTITGIKVTASDEQTADNTAGEKGETVLRGAEGYVLEIKDNPFIAHGQAANVARNIFDQMGGMQFRPFNVSCLGDPSVEPGDPITITDYNLKTYRSYITTCNYRMGAYATLSCGAETPLRKEAASGGKMSKVLQQMRENIRSEKKARDMAIEQLNKDLENSSGIYTTTQTDASGAQTWFVHDKKEIAQSEFVWKMNSAGFGMSIDGGRNYQYGLDKWGNAILENIYAIGINADYITAGALRVKNSSGKTIFCADAGNPARNQPGTFWWDTSNSKLEDNGWLTVTGGKVGGFTVTSDSIHNRFMTLSSSGVRFSTDIGRMGSIQLTTINGRSKTRGLTMGVNYDDGWYVALGAQKTKGGMMQHVFLYSNFDDKANGNVYARDWLHMLVSMDLHSNTLWGGILTRSTIKTCDIDDVNITNAWLDGNSCRFSNGATCTVTARTIDSFGPNGTIKTYKDMSLTFKNGILTYARW